MIRKIYFVNLIVILTFMISVFSLPGFSYEGSDHYRINKYISEHIIDGFSFDTYLKSFLGFEEGRKEVIGRIGWINFSGYEFHIGIPEDLPVFKCLANGGKYEDSPRMRSASHFHDPLKPWLEAGFKGTAFSSILWAQFENQPYGKYSWNDVRSYFYQALISTDPSVRSRNFVKTFEGLGRLMHMVQDSSVPSHTRNDFHMVYNYESYVQNVGDKYSDSIDDTYAGWLSDESRYTYHDSVLDRTPIPSDLLPIARLVDTDRYEWDYTTTPSSPPDPDATMDQAIGLAEYSNANFFSKDTMFKTTDFPFPNLDSIEKADDVPIPDPRDPSRMVYRQFYTKARHGDTGYRLCTVPVYDEWTTMASRLDNYVYEDYAKRLIPRAVSYSAGLLKYFFRGTMDIHYSVSESTDYFRVRVCARNSSDNDAGTEAMGSGTVRLVIKYKSAVDKEYQYMVSEPREVLSISHDYHTCFDFDLERYVPIYSCGSTVFLVFQGRLGDETEAVCIGAAKHLDTIEVSLPDEGVYSFIPSPPEDPATQGFDQIKLLVRNNSASGEQLINGRIDLVAEYRISEVDPFKNYDPYPPTASEMHFSHKCLGVADNYSIPSDNPVELSFDLDREIPLWATDVYLYLVYRGDILHEDGSVESNAIRVGFKDICEPTPFTICNGLDFVCIDDILYQTTDPQELAEAKEQAHKYFKGEIEPRPLDRIYIRFSPLVNKLDASKEVGGCLYLMPPLAAGKYKRTYLLSDYDFYSSIYEELGLYPIYTNPFMGISNQLRYDPEHGCMVKEYSIFRSVRGIEMWGGKIYDYWFGCLCNLDDCLGCSDTDIDVNFESVD